MVRDEQHAPFRGDILDALGLDAEVVIVKPLRDRLDPVECLGLEAELVIGARLARLEQAVHELLETRDADALEGAEHGPHGRQLAELLQRLDDLLEREDVLFGLEGLWDRGRRRRRRGCVGIVTFVHFLFHRAAP